MIEVAARDIKTEADVQQWWSKARGDVQEWLTRESTCKAFKRMEYDPNNHDAVIDTRTFDDSRQKQCGYVMGLRLTDIAGADQPFSDCNGLISVFANYVAASRAMTSRL